MTKETRPVAARRRELLRQLLPAGAPRLWCPLLTHYRDDGSLDLERTARQLDAIRPHVGGLLLAGSTGDGWELDEAQRQRLVAEMLPLARERGFAVLLGVLKPTAQGMRQAMAATVAALCAQAGTDDPTEAFARCGVAALTLCAPHGQALSQDELGSALDELLASGVPVSLYQLPQVTGNRIAAATYAALVARHANLLMLKDTSGEDTLAQAADDADGVLLLRGAEGGYARHPKAGGGRYDGALLSTANGLGAALGGVLDALCAGRREQAQALSARIEAVVEPVFAAAAALPVGNAFTNANKALDHVMAHGEAAGMAQPPRLHAGTRLPREFVATAAAALARQGLAPARGYLQNRTGSSA
ncbi:dihydrodipicolinate synthase family protein [Azohydromonas lata]|uniref:Dihydrodipicolinate synthase family protein n=1 Tax=Azohydromonas lata TaxID=45677 RepID=A0ABU5ILS2_9BURK|nr:dihydrodipicolinate synthase family protein [Azohydromonas lata]MDZ5459832.1 dihydrodipicolinate synthase family protein [Azohydromonas lata]